MPVMPASVSARPLVCESSPMMLHISAAVTTSPAAQIHASER